MNQKSSQVFECDAKALATGDVFENYVVLCEWQERERKCGNVERATVFVSAEKHLLAVVKSERELESLFSDIVIV